MSNVSAVSQLNISFTALRRSQPLRALLIPRQIDSTSAGAIFVLCIAGRNKTAGGFTWERI